MPVTSVEFVDRPDLTWTFSDSVTSVVLEGKAICRIEFCTIRWNDLPTAASGRQYPVSRIAMPLKTMIDVHKRLSHILSQLEQEVAPDREELSRSKAIN